MLKWPQASMDVICFFNFRPAIFICNYPHGLLHTQAITARGSLIRNFDGIAPHAESVSNRRIHEVDTLTLSHEEASEQEKERRIEQANKRRSEGASEQAKERRSEGASEQTSKQAGDRTSKQAKE